MTNRAEFATASDILVSVGRILKGMCGRYVSVQSDADLSDEFDVEQVVGDELAPSWNVAPTDDVRIVVERAPHHARADDDAPTATSDNAGKTETGKTETGNTGAGETVAAPVRQLRTARWGLVPHWSKSRSGGVKMINARSETVASKPAFKTAAGRRRCLAPSQGYYEWQQSDDGKIPFFLHAPDEQPLAMAGLYEIWRDDSLPDDDPNRWLWTCTIITRPATDALGAIHDRCPVLVPQDLQEQWLDCRADDPQVAARLLAEMPEPHLEPRQVGRAVGNVKNDGPQLIEPADDDAGASSEAQQLTIDL